MISEIWNSFEFERIDVYFSLKSCELQIIIIVIDRIEIYGQ